MPVKIRARLPPALPTLHGEDADAVEQHVVIQRDINAANDGSLEKIARVSRAFYNLIVVLHPSIVEYISDRVGHREEEMLADYYALVNRLPADDVFAVALASVGDIANVDNMGEVVKIIFDYITKSSIRTRVHDVVSEITKRMKLIEQRERLGYDPRNERIINEYMALRARKESELTRKCDAIDEGIAKLQLIKKNLQLEFEDTWKELEDYTKILTPNEEQRDEWIDEFFSASVDFRERYDYDETQYVTRKVKESIAENKKDFFNTGAGDDLVKKLDGLDLKAKCEELLDKADKYLNLFRAQQPIPKYVPMAERRA